VFNAPEGYLDALPPTVAEPRETTIPPNLGVPWFNTLDPEPQEHWRRDAQEWQPAWD